MTPPAVSLRAVAALFLARQHLARMLPEGPPELDARSIIDAVAFEATRRGEPLGRFEIQMVGRHNAQNALGVVALADEMDEMKTICDCGRKATMNMRVDASNRKVTEGAQVEIGGNARYRSVCGRCFRQG